MAIDWNKIRSNTTGKVGGGKLDWGKIRKNISAPIPAPAPAPAPTGPTPITSSVPQGGQYVGRSIDNVVLKQPRDYGGLAPSEGQQRDHIFPVSLGGTSTAQNVQYRNAADAERRDAVEKYVAREVAANRMSLGAARNLVLNYDTATIPELGLYPNRVTAGKVAAQTIPAAGKVGKAVADFFTGNSQKLVGTAGKNLGEAAAYYTDRNVRGAVTGAALDGLLKQQGELVRRFQAAPAGSEQKSRLKKELLAITETISGQGQNMKTVLPEQGSVTTGQGLKRILGQAIGSGAELASFAGGAGLAKNAAKTGVGALAKSGAISGAKYGAAFGVGSALQENKSLGGVAASGLAGGATGAAAGAALSALIGGIAKAATKKAVQKSVGESTGTYVGGVAMPKRASKSATPKINAGGKTTPKQNAQLQDVLRSLRGDGAVKERGFITSMKESSKTPGPVRDILRGSYVTKSNAELARDAQRFVQDDPVAALSVAMNPRNAVDVEVGNQLLNGYIKSGDFQKVKQIGEAMASSGTELGQAVQAFSNYDKTTPAGAVRYAQSIIHQHNKLGKNTVKLTSEHIQSIYDAAAKIQELPMGSERNIATKELMDTVNDLIPSTVADKAVTVWKAGLLTSLRTHERNLLGNTIQAAGEVAKDVPATAVDKLLALRTGQRTVTATMRGTGEGSAKGWQAAVDIVRTGYDPEQAITKYDVRHVTWGKNPVEQGLKKATDFVFRTLGAEDKVFWNAAYARSLYDQAGAAAMNAGKRGDRAFIEGLVKKPTEQMAASAFKDANYATFHDQNLASQIATGIKRIAASRGGAAGKVLSEVVAPFTGVPSSILGKVVDYSPVGLLNGARHAGTVLARNVPALQRQAAQEVGRGVIGTGLYGLGAYLVRKGILLGRPKDQNQARQWELEGKKANSVLVNGKWRSLGSVGPQTLVLLAGAKAQEELGPNGGGMGPLLSGVGKDFLSQSFLAGVQGPLQAITDPQQYGSSYAKSQVSSVVPNILKDTAKAFDPYVRETNSVTDALRASIPGLRNKLEPRRDALGNIVPQTPTGIGAYVDLFASSKRKSSPVIAELSRLDALGLNATPSKVGKSTTVKGKKLQLNASQVSQLESASSGELQRKLSELIASTKYRGMADDDRVKAIDDVVSAVRKKYRTELIQSILRQNGL